MIRVIGVRFRTAGKIYYFDPGKLEIKKNDHVIVETARGIEYGTVVGDPKEEPEENVIQRLRRFSGWRLRRMTNRRQVISSVRKRPSRSVWKRSGSIIYR